MARYEATMKKLKEAKMRTAGLIAILGVVFLVSGVGVARADFIACATGSPPCNAASPTFSGTGLGTGLGSASTTFINNDNSATASPNIIALTETFTSVNPINATFTLAFSPLGTEYFGSNLVFNNNTGKTWTSIKFELFTPALTQINLDGLDFDTPLYDPAPLAAGFFANPPSTPNEDTLVWSGGTGLPSGGTVNFTFSIDMPTGTPNDPDVPKYPNFIIRTTPIAPVPEPSSLLLLGSGLAGLGLWHRWRRRHS